MKKLELTHKFPYSLEQVLAAREKRWEDKKAFEEISDHKELEERTEGDIKYKKRQLGVSTFLPAILRNMLPNKMLEVIEDSRYNVKENTHTFFVYIDNHKDKFSIDGRTDYIVESPETCRREIVLKISSSVPFLGGMIESQTLNIYRRNLEKDFVNIAKIIEKMN